VAADVAPPDVAAPDVNPTDASVVDAVPVTDASGHCAPPILTYANFGMSFLVDTYCNSCHGWTLQAVQSSPQLLFDVAAAGPGFVNTLMPPGGLEPSLSDRISLGTWLDCGAP